MKNLSLLLVLFIFVSSCKKVKDEAATQDFLQGKWQSQLDPATLYFAGCNYKLEFQQDSFFCEWDYFTDVVEVDDCYPRKNKNFIAGSFSLAMENINFDGQFVDSIFNNLNSDTCRKMGVYNITNGIIKRGDTLLIEMPFSFQVSSTKENLKFIKQ